MESAVARIAGYTRADGTKVKGHTRKGGKRAKRRTQGKAKGYTKSQRAALKKSRTSKSGHKTWRQRQRQKKPGLWANVHAKRAREGRKG